MRKRENCAVQKAVVDEELEVGIVGGRYRTEGNEAMDR